jgi:hypothetical protein
VQIACDRTQTIVVLVSELEMSKKRGGEDASRNNYFVPHPEDDCDYGKAIRIFDSLSKRPICAFVVHKVTFHTSAKILHLIHLSIFKYYKVLTICHQMSVHCQFH